MTDATPTPTTPNLKAITRTARDPAATAEQLQACAGQGESIDRLLAKHPNASAQLLEQLSHSSDRATRKAVTLHPNTPKDALLKLAPQFPGDFFQNPAFDWLLIEHPNLMFDIGGGVLKNVLKRAECPQSFMAWAAAHGSEQERLAVAMNPQAQADVLQAIERKGGKAAQAAQQHANHPLASGEVDLESTFRKAVEQEIAESFADNNVPTLAQWPALSLVFRLDSNLEYCVDYLTHRLAPSALVLPALTALAGDVASDVRWTVASNPAVPADILVTLADDPTSWKVRWAALANPAIPEHIRADILTARAGDSNLGRLCEVAKNPATPAAVLGTLASSASSPARQAAASNPSISFDVLLTLAGDGESDVRCAVARNRSTPSAVLAALAADESSGVRDRAAENPATPAEALAKLAADSDQSVRCAVAKNPATPVAVLTKLAADSNKYLRAEVASNPAAPMDIRRAIVTELASDTDWYVRCRIAANPASSASILTELASDPDADSGRLVAFRSNPNARREWLDERNWGVLGAVASNPVTPAAVLGKLAGDRSEAVRNRVAKNLATPAATLTKLAGDSDPDVRWAVVCNPATPADTVVKLVAKACSYVQKEVLDPRRSRRWTSEVAKLKPKEAELIRACNEGDVLYLPDRLAEKACRKTDLAWRVLGLSHRIASPEDLAKRSRSTEWVERMAVARNPNTPPNIIEALRKDPHRLVARQAEATAALKSGATERQSQLLQEMPSDSGDQMVANETGQRLRKRYQSDFWDLGGSYGELYFSRWVRCMAPGLWLMGLNATTQARLEAELPSLLRQAMSDYWADPSIPLAEINEPARLLVLRLLAQRPMTKELQDRVRRLAKDCRWVAYDPSTPSSILAAMAGHSVEAVRRSVAGNPSTPGEILAKLARDSKSWVRRSVFENPATPAAALATLADDADVRLHADPTPTPTPPIADLAALSSDPCESVRHGVAQNHATPVDLLTKLAGDPDCWVRHAVADNPATQADIRLAALATLATDSVDRECVTVARKIATDTATPGDILGRLAAHSCDWVRTFVTENTATPASVLAAMDRDPAYSVRKGLAKNPATPATVLAQLAGDPEADVRAAVAANGATPSAALAKLAGDPTSDVRRNVAKNPATLPAILVQLVEDSDSAVRAVVATNPAIPAEILGTLAVDSDLDVRSKAAGNPATPAPALATLDSDAAWRVRWAVAANSASPSSTLVTLAGDLNWRVCLAAVNNPNASAEMLLVPTADADADTRRAGAIRCAELGIALATESRTPKQSAVVQSWIAELQAGLAEPVVLKDVSDSEFRLAFDALGLMPPESDKRAIAKAAKSKDWLERAAATYAPGIQPSLLKLLLEDPVEAVRQCAVKRLRVVA